MDMIIVVGCHVGGLAVVRALGKQNMHIIVLTYDRTDIGDVSKYVAERIECPHPGQDEAGFVKFLLEHGPRWQGALILETGDYSAVVISKHKALLSSYFQIVTAEWPILSQFIDKGKTYALADGCGVAHPQTFKPTSVADIHRIKRKISYPCILKPIYSHEFVRRYGVKNFEVADEAELVRRFQLCLDAAQPVIAQEIVLGPDTDIFRLQTYINSTGEMSAQFFHRKVRQNPPQFGVMRVGISTERDAEVADLSARLLTHAGYRGYCSIEFRKDTRDGQLKLIEVNVRMPRSGWFAVASGVNFPWIIYLDLVRNEQIYVPEYTVGLYWIESLSDIYNSLFRRKREDYTLADYCRPYFARHRAFAVLDMRDPKPCLRQMKGVSRLIKGTS